MANITLPIKMLVDVAVDYTPKLLQRDDFGRLCIIGSSETTRETPIGIYADLNGVANDYADDTKEYQIAKNYFAQIPRPKTLMIATAEGVTYKV